jgi:hypothetical protein
MANFERVNEYQSYTALGVTRIQTTGHGMRVNTEKVTTIYQEGIGYDGETSHNVFTVYLDGARSFVTDWAGIGTIGGWVRVNEYARIVLEDGTRILQYTDHGMRVVPNNVVRVYTAGLGYELDGETTHECFKVTMVDGRSFITDWQGWQDIINY